MKINSDANNYRIQTIDTSKYYLFYDGECKFCNRWVNYILENDKKDQFRFSPLQSNFAQKFLKERNLNTKDFDTIYLWKPNSFYLTKSEAIIKISKLVGGRLSIIRLGSLLPVSFTDLIYNLIAKNRNKIISKQCRIPSENERKKFIE